MSISAHLIDTADKDKSHNNIITEDETWYFLYDPQTKQQSPEWTSSSSQSKNFQGNWAKRKGYVRGFFLTARALSIMSSYMKVKV
jgi:hypothetical protein